MKIGHLIVQYLFQNKSVTLQEIGSFYLSPEIVIPQEGDKETPLPDNAIRFEYNTRAGQDEGLIDYIVQHTRKIRPLATSDLESYSILGREYLNIGKPFAIEGLGYLQKNQSGDYEFVQSHALHPVSSSPASMPSSLREKEEGEISFTTPARQRRQAKPLWIGLVALLLLLLVPASIYYLMREDNFTNDATPVLLDSLPVANNVADTIQPETVVTPPPPDTAFTLAVKQFRSRETADREMTKLNNYGHRFEVMEKDSVFLLVLNINRPLTDSSRVMDSVNRFFNVRSYPLPNR